MEFTTTKEIVLRLKAVKEKDNLTIQDILERLEAAGFPLSESTVRRVFRDGSEDEGGFTYVKVLKPIADVLLDEDESGDDPALVEKNEALHAIIKEKNRMIDVLEDRNDALTKRNEDLKQRIDEFRAEYDVRLRFLRDQIELKDKQMSEKDQLINRLLDKLL